MSNHIEVRMRLTTDTPQGNLEQSLNLFYAKDGETWVRGAARMP